jgi:hypothetical protein
VTWLAALAVGLGIGLACGGTLMTWWSSRRIEREAKRQYEIGVAEGVVIAERDQQGKVNARDESTSGRQRRRNALRRAGRAGDAA